MGYLARNFNRSTVIFYFFVRWAKIIFIDYQQLRKYFKNNCPKVCVYHIPDIYLCHQIKTTEKWNTHQYKSKTLKELTTLC